MYLRLLIFLPAILIPASASSRPVFLMMHSAYKLNKQGDNIQPWYTPFSIWNQSVVCCSMRLSEGSNKPCALQDPETPQRLRQKLHSTSQSQTCIKKSHTHCLVVCYPSATTFWILVKPLHLRSILSKLTTRIENCNACSWHESTERAQFFSRTMPNRITHNQHFESWTNLGYEILPPLPHSPDLTNQLPPLQSSQPNFFARKMLLHPAGGRRYFSRVLWIPKHGFFCCRNKPTISFWQN